MGRNNQVVYVITTYYFSDEMSLLCSQAHNII